MCSFKMASFEQEAEKDDVGYVARNIGSLKTFWFMYTKFEIDQNVIVQIVIIFYRKT